MRGNFSAANSDTPSFRVLNFISVLHDVSYVFVTKNKIEQLFKIFDNLDYLREM